jgi:multidrug efflux pump subunit AcrA (membrane-fusion protein)
VISPLKQPPTNAKDAAERLAAPSAIGARKLDMPEPLGQPRAISRWIAGGAAALALLLAAWWFSSPEVPASSLRTATVKQGDLPVVVAGQGKLSPSKLLTITSTSGGVVTGAIVLPGSEIRRGQTILQLSNSDLQQRLMDARRAKAAADASAAEGQSALLDQSLEIESRLGELSDQIKVGEIELKGLKTLADKQIIATLQYERARVALMGLQRQLQQTQRRRAQLLGSRDQRLAAINSMRAIASAEVEALEAQVAALAVTSPQDGVGYELSEGISEGSAVAPGAVIARISDTRALTAEVKVAASMADRIRIGQPVALSVGPTKLAGRVSRIDPRVVQDEVVLSVAIPDASGGLRAGQPLTAEVAVGSIPDVVYVARPYGVAENRTQPVYVLATDGGSARRREVHFGAASGESIVVDSGAVAGEHLVVSDMSRFAGSPKVGVNHDR